MNKPPLILLPGTLCDKRLWQHQVENLSSLADVSVVMLTEDDSIEDMARRVLKEAPERFALAGLSLGGIVALEIVKQAPERVLKLALLDTNPRSPREEQAETWEKFIDMAESGEFRQITKDYLLPVLIHPDSQKNEELTSEIVKMADNIGKSAMVRQMRALISKPDGRAALNKIGCPTLVMTGENDTVCTMDMHVELAENIKNSKLVTIDHCGHLSSMEQPEAVSAVLQYWLQC
ncbi:Pimeloyl-ACP methyl ester carboxylesterase [Halobacillus dabanensis]|uniref:Pimeloyl-ACP methyl ester carboxylesterase n=1 Tax=Halobacillus dabanensis TaxID=240302 RepID=A0A1I3WCE8_HALDA|nr:alpha/beta hydrolase [Halobacillus dabanensis]SFK05344.1 Pimeloyl-ACP methyl ester carboxylesterase [Halobacillus dabanensis]